MQKRHSIHLFVKVFDSSTISA